MSIQKPGQWRNLDSYRFFSDQSIVISQIRRREGNKYNWIINLTCCFSFSSISKIWYAIYIFLMKRIMWIKFCSEIRRKWTNLKEVLTSVPVVSPDCLSCTRTFLLSETSLFIAFTLLYVCSLWCFPFWPILNKNFNVYWIK